MHNILLQQNLQSRNIWIGLCHGCASDQVDRNPFGENECVLGKPQYDTKQN
jgi:hypothetical protein